MSFSIFRSTFSTKVSAVTQHSTTTQDETSSGLNSDYSAREDTLSLARYSTPEAELQKIQTAVESVYSSMSQADASDLNDETFTEWSSALDQINSMIADLASTSNTAGLQAAQTLSDQIQSALTEIQSSTAMTTAVSDETLATQLNGITYTIEAMTETLASYASMTPEPEPVFQNDIQVNSATSGTQNSSHVTVLSNGNRVLVWVDGSSSNSEIKGQLYDADGNTVGSEFSVGYMEESGSYYASEDVAPIVTERADGEFVIAFETTIDPKGSGESATGIVAQNYNADGTLEGPLYIVNTTSAGDQTDPSITTLADGGYVITWTSEGQDGDGSGVYGQRYDRDGNAVGSEFQVNSSTAGDQTNNAVTALADGGFVVAYESATGGRSQTDIYLQRFDSNGNAVGTETLVNNNTFHRQNEVSLTGLSDGGYIVAWTSFEPGSGAEEIFAQRYDSNGEEAGAEFRINASSDLRQTDAHLTELADGRIAAVWTSADQDGSDDGVYARIFTLDGTAVTGEMRISDQTVADQNQASISATSNGFVISYTGTDESGAAIRMREVVTSTSEIDGIQQTLNRAVELLNDVSNDSSVQTDAHTIYHLLTNAQNEMNALIEAGNAYSNDLLSLASQLAVLTSNLSQSFTNIDPDTQTQLKELVDLEDNFAALSRMLSADLNRTFLGLSIYRQADITTPLEKSSRMEGGVGRTFLDRISSHLGEGLKVVVSEYSVELFVDSSRFMANLLTSVEEPALMIRSGDNSTLDRISNAFRRLDLTPRPQLHYDVTA